MRNEIAAALRSEFKNLRGALRSFDRTLQRAIAVNVAGQTPNGGARGRPRLSAKARASLVLQGRYMGYMRQLRPKQKAMVRRIKLTKGIRPAIAKAKSVASAVER